jgi:serine/threonine protein phosphatase PrpC
MDTGITIEHAYYNRPFLGERFSGDLPIHHEDLLYLYFVLIDGLGHGEQAHSVSKLISQKIKACWSPNPYDIISNLNQRLNTSIGASIGVFVLNKNSLKFRYSGLGNIRCKIILKESIFNLVSTDGILGMRYRSPKIQEGSIQPEEMVLLFSDGVNNLDHVENWNKFRSLKCTTIVRRIVNHFGTDIDDSSCIALKINGIYDTT